MVFLGKHFGIEYLTASTNHPHFEPVGMRVISTICWDLETQREDYAGNFPHSSHRGKRGSSSPNGRNKRISASCETNLSLARIPTLHHLFLLCIDMIRIYLGWSEGLCRNADLHTIWSLQIGGKCTEEFGRYSAR